MQAVTRGGRGTAGAPRSWDFCRPCHGNGGDSPRLGLGKEMGQAQGSRAAVKQVPWEEGQAEGSFVEERREEGNAGL